MSNVMKSKLRAAREALPPPPPPPTFDNFPQFYSVDQFCDMIGSSKSHIQHGAGNYIQPGRSTSRAKLPPGWGAFMWSNMLIICEEKDLWVVKKLFAIPD